MRTLVPPSSKGIAREHMCHLLHNIHIHLRHPHHLMGLWPKRASQHCHHLQPGVAMRGNKPRCHAPSLAVQTPGNICQKKHWWRISLGDMFLPAKPCHPLCS